MYLIFQIRLKIPMAAILEFFNFSLIFQDFDIGTKFDRKQSERYKYACATMIVINFDKSSP